VAEPPVGPDALWVGLIFHSDYAKISCYV